MPAKGLQLFQRCFRSVASNYARLPIVDGFKMSHVDSVSCVVVFMSADAVCWPPSGRRGAGGRNQKV